MLLSILQVQRTFSKPDAETRKSGQLGFVDECKKADLYDAVALGPARRVLLTERETQRERERERERASIAFLDRPMKIAKTSM